MPNEDVDRAIRKFKSLHDQGFGILAAIACGQRAIPALRDLLFEREPSGLFHARCRAVAALEALLAYDVLFEFVSSPREAPDPVERFGDDAVMNAAAIALAELREERVFQLLMRRAAQCPHPGLISALASFDRREAVPHLVRALAEDADRIIAEKALRRHGARAREALVEAAARRPQRLELESESDRRRRRSALRLLLDVGMPKKTWAALRSLLDDPDHHVSVLAGKICLATAPVRERIKAVRRMIALLPEVDWMLREEIEDSLAAQHESAGEVFEAAISEVEQFQRSPVAKDLALRALARARQRAQRKLGPAPKDS